MKDNKKYRSIYEPVDMLSSEIQYLSRENEMPRAFKGQEKKANLVANLVERIQNGCCN